MGRKWHWHWLWRMRVAVGSRWLWRRRGLEKLLQLTRVAATATMRTAIVAIVARKISVVSHDFRLRFDTSKKDDESVAPFTRVN